MCTSDGQKILAASFLLLTSNITINNSVVPCHEIVIKEQLAIFSSYSASAMSEAECASLSDCKPC